MDNTTSESGIPAIDDPVNSSARDGVESQDQGGGGGAVVPLQGLESSDDDWEAIADRPPDQLLSPNCLPQVSTLSLHTSELKNKLPNRRGRGTFTYNKQGLYSEVQTNGSTICETSDDIVHDKSQHISEPTNLYGTRHVLVLDGFHPSTSTTELEKLFEDFRDRGFAIRWVNDTLALAVFQSPSVAVEAKNSIHCSFKVRVLEEDDSMMSSISINDLDPPRQRPKTSARTAQRLIAQELGMKLPSTFGSRELKKQENDRRNRIVARQTLRDEAFFFFFFLTAVEELRSARV